LSRRQAPVAGSQTSEVQALPSLQSIGGCVHSPLDASHRSCVHRSPSAQSRGVPSQRGAGSCVVTHRSLSVQALPSSHALPAGSGFPAHWCVASQVSLTVQALPSSHGSPAARMVPGEQSPALHDSPTVHEFPSSQGVPVCGVWKQPPTTPSSWKCD
jgi:hypothetical protein